MEGGTMHVSGRDCERVCVCVCTLMGMCTISVNMHFRCGREFQQHAKFWSFGIRRSISFPLTCRYITYVVFDIRPLCQSISRKPWPSLYCSSLGRTFANIHCTRSNSRAIPPTAFSRVGTSSTCSQNSPAVRQRCFIPLKEGGGYRGEGGDHYHLPQGAPDQTECVGISGRGGHCPLMPP